ncbi:hypothetical protein L798_13651 [Zootermopsis nevadensis]|uniref:Uncharacterized protein n=1 Tax=Zootermopsis nevadensis TaxID=136037 RepID=A0A067R3T9_ZOONE|nr:hypothetical protein L798_13651 [Zootermopsis nevadensis]
MTSVYINETNLTGNLHFHITDSSAQMLEGVHGDCISGAAEHSPLYLQYRNAEICDRAGVANPRFRFVCCDCRIIILICLYFNNIFKTTTARFWKGVHDEEELWHG